MTPTSGDQPYIFDISFNQKENFGDHYSFEFAQHTTVDSCPVDLSARPPTVTITNELLLNETYTFTSGSVPVGSCRAAVARIRRLSDNSIIDAMTVTINNV